MGEVVTTIPSKFFVSLASASTDGDAYVLQQISAAAVPITIANNFKGIGNIKPILY